MTKIQCNFENYTDYTCIISKQEINDEQIFFDGVHKKDKQNLDVDNLQFFNCVFHKMPKNIHESFPNLRKLSFWNSKMNFIEREHVGKLTELRSLEVINCGLRNLNGDLLCDLKKLRKVSFANNKIENIDSDLLDGLDNLNFVNFRGNLCINMLYDSETIGGNTLNNIKEEIRYRHKPKPTAPIFPPPQDMPMPNSVSTFKSQNTNVSDISPPPYDEKFEILRWKTENEYLKAEIKNLKILLQQQEDIIQNQQEKISVMNEEKQKEENLKKIFNDENFKDFTINVSESSFKIHKILFASFSSFLDDYFKNNPDANELNLTDIPVTSFKAVYDFVYKNQLSEDANYLEILAAAEKFKIDNMITETTALLLDEIDEKNALEVLEFSNKIKHAELNQKAFEIIQTKIFPDRKLDISLAKQPEKLKKLIEIKRKMDEEYEKMLQQSETNELNDQL